jgi:hypothetical protein
VFDGVGDLRNDTDELLYLIPKDENDGSITVSVEAGETGKVRGNIQPRTFRLNKDRTVSEVDYVDVVEDLAEAKMLADDQTFIQMVIEAINAKCCTQTAIITYCANNSKDWDKPMSQKKTIAMLKRYNHGTDGPVRWYSQRGMASHAWNYSVTPF